MKRNLESDPSYHLLKKALKKKSANDSLRDVSLYSMDVHTHTLATQRERFTIPF